MKVTNIKQKVATVINRYSIVAVIAMSCVSLGWSNVALAHNQTALPAYFAAEKTADGSEKPKFEQKNDPALDCSQKGASANKCDLVQKYLNPIIAFFSAFVGIAVTIGIISGGIRYASASDDPQKSAAGRQMIRNSIIALIAYIFLLAALRWLAPSLS